jgi:predicted ArsR family transcriptional regulator
MRLADSPALPMVEIVRRIIAALRGAGQPRRTWELADDLGIACDTVLRALDWLAELGLVTVSRDGWSATDA